MRMKTMTLVLVLLFPILAAAQDTTIKRVPPPRTSRDSGRQMYTNYCAACHGLSGNGDGPAVPALKAAPTDLTKLAAQNGGKFPENRVMDSIRLSPPIPAHGSKEMPVWGNVFASMSGSKPDSPFGEAAVRVHNLTEYIKTLQGKS